VRGAKLTPRNVIVGSLAIPTGHATFSLVHKGLVLGSGASRTQAAKGLTLRMRRSANGVLVTLAAAKGAFVSMTRPVVGRSSISFSVTKKAALPPPPPPATTTTGTTTPPPTSPPPPPTSPPPPPPTIG
jgi:hypothetical protein